MRADTLQAAHKVKPAFDASGAPVHGKVIRKRSPSPSHMRHPHSRPDASRGIKRPQHAKEDRPLKKRQEVRQGGVPVHPPGEASHKPPAPVEEGEIPTSKVPYLSSIRVADARCRIPHVQGQRAQTDTATGLSIAARPDTRIGVLIDTTEALIDTTGAQIDTGARQAADTAALATTAARGAGMHRQCEGTGSEVIVAAGLLVTVCSRWAFVESSLQQWWKARASQQPAWWRSTVDAGSQPTWRRWRYAAGEPGKLT